MALYIPPDHSLGITPTFLDFQRHPLKTADISSPRLPIPFDTKSNNRLTVHMTQPELRPPRTPKSHSRQHSHQLHPLTMSLPRTRVRTPTAILNPVIQSQSCLREFLPPTNRDIYSNLRHYPEHCVPSRKTLLSRTMKRQRLLQHTTAKSSKPSLELLPQSPNPKESKSERQTHEQLDKILVSPPSSVMLRPVNQVSTMLTSSSTMSLSPTRRDPLLDATTHIVHSPNHHLALTTTSLPSPLPTPPPTSANSSLSKTWVFTKDNVPTPTLSPMILDTPSAKKPADCSKFTVETLNMRNSSPKSPQEFQTESPPPNGIKFSVENPSTSIISCRRSTILSLMKRERLALETQRSAVQWMNQNDAFRQRRTGLQPGDSHLQQSPSSFLTALTSFQNTAITSSTGSTPKTHPTIPESSSMTDPSGLSSKVAKTCFSPTSNSSTIFSTPLSCPEGPHTQTIRPLCLSEDSPTSVISSTPLPDVSFPTLNASTDTSASAAESLDITRPTAPNSYSASLGFRPKYLRQNLWNVTTNFDFSPTTADWSETASPFPRPPPSFLNDAVSNQTLKTHSHLFRVITPIDVELFERLLTPHPNPHFTASIIQGLKEGFWPFVSHIPSNYPITFDASNPSPQDPAKHRFINDQLAIEIDKQRFSHAFGPDLFPSMFSMPIHVVPKPNSSDFRLVTDHSASKYSLNSMIDHDKVKGFPLDNLKHFGEILIHAHEHEDIRDDLVVWKSDIAEAYRLMPMHPIWQLKQINTIDGKRYVDRNNAFGTSSSGAIFIGFNSLVAWIAKHVYKIPSLITYVDDTSGFSPKYDVTFYEPYQRFMPTSQTHLLHLWDALRIPHKDKKQLHGPVLPIIGIVVDPNEMTLKLPDDRRMALVDALLSWTVSPVAHKPVSFKLKY